MIVRTQTAEPATLLQLAAVAPDLPVLAPLTRMLEASGYKRCEDAAFKQALHGLVELLRHHLAAEEEVPLSVELLEIWLAEIEKRMQRQLDEILHHPEFQQLEGHWRELRYLVDHVVPPRDPEGARAVVEILDATKADLASDLAGRGPIHHTTFFRTVYSPYDTYGGHAYGLLVAPFDLSFRSADVELLRRLACVAAHAHAPLLANVDPDMFQLSSMSELCDARDLRQFEGSEYAAWNSFRDSEEARFVTLCLPRFVLRRPYDPEYGHIESFAYREHVHDSSDRYLWGHASTALAARAIASFLAYGWCGNITGPRAGGLVTGLPMHIYDALGALQTKCPLEVAFTDTRASELARAGFCALEYRYASDQACFFGAPTAHRVRRFGPAEHEAESAARLAAQLQNVFLVCRLGHMTKSYFRTEIGQAKSPTRVEEEQTRWLGNWVVANETDLTTMAEKPLRAVKVKVEELPNQPGQYRSRIEIQPHRRLLGVDITLSLVTRVEKSEPR